PGQTIEIGAATAGARIYVAVSGGIDCPPVLGSRSTDLLSGLGPPPLAEGQRLALGADVDAVGVVDVAPVRSLPARPVLHVSPGPRAEWFAPDAFARLVGEEWTVLPDSNRIGVRLDGSVLTRAVATELPPEGLVAGSLQVPAAGTPVLFLNDHPVTGGYPVLAVVSDADLDLAAQLAPGVRLRFARTPTARMAR
ncbi:MAG: biotin-dependent carboxyltransferase family protein, partial [Acidimicrobiales bacterium]